MLTKVEDLNGIQLRKEAFILYKIAAATTGL